MTNSQNRHKSFILQILLIFLGCCSCALTLSVTGKSQKTGDKLTNEISPKSETNAIDEVRAASSGSGFYYPVVRGQQQQQIPQWSRDSYSDAASEFGYNLGGNSQHVAEPAHAHSYAPSYSVPSPSYGLTGHDDDFDFDGIGPIGGVGAVIAGLLGLKGLKGLGILGLLKAGFLGLIPLFFLLLPALIIIPLLLLVLPFPVITVPSAGTGRRIIDNLAGFNVSDWTGRMTTLAFRVAESDKCVERMSCEMSRIGRGSIFDRTIKRMFARFEPHMPGAFQRIARGYMEPSECKRYGCFIMDDFRTKKTT